MATNLVHESTLVLCLDRRDEEAVKKFFHRVWPRLVQRVERLMRSGQPGGLESAEDVSQDALSSFIFYLNRPETSIIDCNHATALLLRMAKCRCVDAIRRNNRARRLHHQGDTNDISQIDRASDAGTASELAISRECVENAAGSFSKSELYMIEARGRGETWAQIGESLGVNKELLRSKVRRAVARVQREFPDIANALLRTDQ